MNEVKYSKSFKLIVGVLSIGWLSVLSANVFSPNSLHTSVFDTEGNVIGEEFILSNMNGSDY